MAHDKDDDQLHGWIDAEGFEEVDDDEDGVDEGAIDDA